MTPSYASEVYGIPDSVLADVNHLLAADLRGPVQRTEAIADIAEGHPERLPAVLDALVRHVNGLHAAHERSAPVRVATVIARDEAEQRRRGGGR